MSGGFFGGIKHVAAFKRKMGRALTLAMKAKLKNYSAEDRSHGFVLEISFHEDCKVDIEVIEANENSTPLKHLQSLPGTNYFNEYLFSYEDMAGRDHFYIILKIEKGDQVLRSKFPYLNTFLQTRQDICV